MVDAETGLMGRRKRLVAGSRASLASCLFYGLGCGGGVGASGGRVLKFGEHRSAIAIRYLAMQVAAKRSTCQSC